MVARPAPGDAWRYRDGRQARDGVLIAVVGGAQHFETERACCRRFSGVGGPATLSGWRGRAVGGALSSGGDRRTQSSRVAPLAARAPCVSRFPFIAGIHV